MPTASAKPQNGRLQLYQTMVTALLAPAVLWIGLKVAEINGNRFTANDGADMQREISHIWQEIRGLPPDSFEAKVDGIVERLHRLEVRLEKHIAEDK